MYSETTRGIKVTVEPVYLDEQSSPNDGQFVWAYHVRIENGSPATVQLRARHWRGRGRRRQGRRHGRGGAAAGPGSVPQARAPRR